MTGQVEEHVNAWRGYAITAAALDFSPEGHKRKERRERQHNADPRRAIRAYQRFERAIRIQATQYVSAIRCVCEEYGLKAEWACGFVHGQLMQFGEMFGAFIFTPAYMGGFRTPVAKLEHPYLHYRTRAEFRQAGQEVLDQLWDAYQQERRDAGVDLVDVGNNLERDLYWTFLYLCPDANGRHRGWPRLRDELALSNSFQLEAAVRNMLVRLEIENPYR